MKPIVLVLAVLAVAGNIITSWSWFGVNMLGRGLHSYGFIDSAAFWLIVFVATQLALIALGSWPLRLWRSGPAPHDLTDNSRKVPQRPLRAATRNGIVSPLSSDSSISSLHSARYVSVTQSEPGS